MIVTIGGTAASGKTTLAKRLSKILGFKHISAGAIMRGMAEERGVSLIELSKYAEEHPEVDKEIDRRQKELIEGDCVIDGRLSGIFISSDLKIWLNAPMDTRVERAVGRGEGKPEKVRTDILEREESEKTRYMEFYSIDISDMSPYDLIINTDRFGIKEMTELAKSAIRLASGQI